METGKVRLVWRDFAWIGEESRTAAQAARCAGQQSKFWEYHDALYANQRGYNLGQFSPANLRAFADCLQRGADLPEIQQQLAEGRAAGVTATPTFVINGRRVAGAQSPNGFAALLDAELARLGQ